MSDIEDAPAPREIGEDLEVRCPECGGEPNYQPDEALAVQERLQSNGYLHNDISIKCTECGHSWPHGVPRGEWDGYGDLSCEACGHETMLVHRVRLNTAPEDGEGEVTLHLKCPECYKFDRTARKMDRNGVSLVGYPQLTGEIDSTVNPYGWLPDRHGQPERADGGLEERPADED